MATAIIVWFLMPVWWLVATYFPHGSRARNVSIGLGFAFMLFWIWYSRDMNK